MDLESGILNKAVFSLDDTQTKALHKGRCEECGGETQSASNPYCTRCALAKIREVAQSLKRYL